VTADHKNDTASPSTLVQSTGFAVAQVPVSMGTFNIEDENVQDAFRNQLVLSELWRMLCQWCDQSVLAFGNLASK
jgi:hypothetical protein